MSRTLNLNAYLYFETVARRRSITRAAEELTVSPSAVSQQIKLLEQQLGIRLFRREGRRLSLTLEGEQLFQTSTTSLTMLRDAQRNLGRTRDSRRFNLRVTPSFGVRWLAPRLHDFIAQHPDWDLRVDAAPDPTDFDREVMDLDIRYGRDLENGNRAGFHTSAVLHDHVLPLCSPAYLAALHETPDRLENARLIDSARALCGWDRWFLEHGFSSGSNRKTILMDRSSMALQLALDGAGVVLESLALALPEVVEGRLVPVTPHLPVLRFPAYWALCPTRHISRRSVRLFMEWQNAEAGVHEETLSKVLREHSLEVKDITP